jgi:hypothetical protein
MWAEEEAWMDFRTTQHPVHVPSNITTLVQQEFLPGSGGKRKRKGVDGEEIEQLVHEEIEQVVQMEQSVDGEEIEQLFHEEIEQVVQMEQTTQATTAGRSPDNRRWCFRCTYKIRMDNANGRDKPKNVSRLDGSKPKDVEITKVDKRLL